MNNMGKLHEECGVFGIFSKSRKDLAGSVYFGLHALQHRGQEGAGIVVNDDGVFTYRKDLGLVSEVFSSEALEKLGAGNIAIGHVRYSTSGSNDRMNVQPIVVRHIKGSMALCHNGNLTNSSELRRELELNGSIFHSTSDTEVISYIITKERLTAPSIESAVVRAMDKIRGAYSLVIMSPSKMIAVRDPNGFRPIAYGVTDEGDYVVASESCALDAVGAKFIRDLEPGEVVVFTASGVKSMRDHVGKAPRAMCIFEYIYFARPDSVLDGCSVHEARLRAGAFLADEHPVEADVVIGVPDSGIDGALGYAARSGIPYGVGLIKNKYVGRTFIAPDQKLRERAVRMKLNAIPITVKGKRIVLIDDSIVRGTTSARIVKLLRDAGAAEVHMRVTAPKFVGACYYGTDIDDPSCLIANNHTTEEIAAMIGVDSLGFLSIASAVKLPDGGVTTGYCTGCFSREYPTAIPTERTKGRFERKISEKGE